MMNSQPSLRCLICDIRSTQIPDPWSSGVSVFTKNLIEAYVDLLKNSQYAFLEKKILLVGRGSLPHWVSPLIQESGHLVSYTSYEFRFWRDWLKWRSVWSSKVYRFFQNLEDFVWLAPFNFDSPQFFSTPQKTIVQIVHDLAPLKKSLGFAWWKRLAARYWYKKHEAYAKTIATVSESVQKDLDFHACLLEPGIDKAFGSHPSLWGMPSCEEERKRLLDQFGSHLTETQKEESLSRPWVLAVGRNAKYKNWVFAEEVVKSQFSMFAPLLIWVGSSSLHSGSFQPSWPYSVGFSHVTRLADLSAFYRVSDLLIHPSLYEGFGLPLAEAFCSGLPVLCHRSLPAQERMTDLARGSRADFLMNRAKTFSLSEWEMLFQSLLSDLKDPSSHLFRLRQALSQSPTRSQLAQICGKKEDEFFSWKRTAQQLFALVSSENQFLDQSQYLPVDRLDYHI